MAGLQLQEPLLLSSNNRLRKKTKPYFRFLIVIKPFSLLSKYPLNPAGPAGALGVKAGKDWLIENVAVRLLVFYQASIYKGLLFGHFSFQCAVSQTCLCQQQGKRKQIISVFNSSNFIIACSTLIILGKNAQLFCHEQSENFITNTIYLRRE